MTIEMTFCGAAGTVTGSCTLIRHPRGAFIVDCGLFQGSKTVRELNYRPFPFRPGEPAAVLLTHAHIDHSGLLPKLTRQGFKGRIFATRPTADLLQSLLPDSGYIQETEVERLNRRNRQRGQPQVTPIYTRHDAEAALDHIQPVPYGEWQMIMPGVHARFWDAGHILGSASIEVEVERDDGLPPTTLLFSGDLGPGDKPFHPDPDSPSRPDYLILESTYGDRERDDVSASVRQALLRQEIADAMAAGGNLVIPVFAVERTQELLYDLDALFDSGVLPALDVFLDSPLAVTVTEVFDRHLPDVNISGTPHPFHRGNLHPLVTVDQSMTLNRVQSGAIIMAASGMCEAGRIRHHLKNNLWRPESTVLLVGYQAPGTLGHLLQQDVKRVRIHGEEIEVRARIRSLDVYSGHADRRQLLAWAARRHPVRQGIFLVHGEESARASLRDGLIEQGEATGLIHMPELDATVALTLDGPKPCPGTVRDTVRDTVRGTVCGAKPALAATDWHNRYAETLLELSETLRDLKDDSEREMLLSAMQTLMRCKGATRHR